MPLIADHCRWVLILFLVFPIIPKDKFSYFEENVVFLLVNQSSDIEEVNDGLG